MNGFSDVIKDLMVLSSDVGNLRGENRSLKQENEFLRNLVAPIKVDGLPATNRQQAKAKIADIIADLRTNFFTCKEANLRLCHIELILSDIG